MKRLAAIFLTALLASAPALACTTAVISAKASATGRPMLWKQRDTSAGLNYIDCFFAEPGKYSFTGVVNTSDLRRESVWSGVNETGFAIMNSQSYGLSPIVTDDRPWEGIIMKKALETCATVDEFEAYILSLPQPNGLEANFGVIDAQGGAAFFEVHDYACVRFDVADAPEGYLIRSNWSMTGREGEGKGYDRYDMAAERMASLPGGVISAEWIFERLGREEPIARWDKTVGSVVIEGVGQEDRVDSSVIWCVSGFTPCCYAIAAWPAAGAAIATPLRSASGRGSQANSLADRLKKKHADVRSSVLLHEITEFNEARLLDESFRKEGIDLDKVRRYNDAAAARFREFSAGLGSL